MVSNHRVKHVFRLPFLTKRMVRSDLKGKALAVDPDHHHSHIYTATQDEMQIAIRAKELGLGRTRTSSSYSYSDIGSDSDSENENENGNENLRHRLRHRQYQHQHQHQHQYQHKNKNNRLVRIVSWASIKDRCRWTREQERELEIAQGELARCQKAWSSEQEVWLAYIKSLHDEKEAHEDFLLHRAKQLGDEQQHFRKAWDRTRRRSSQDQDLDLLQLQVQLPLQLQPQAQPRPLTWTDRMGSGENSKRVARLRGR